MGPGNIGLALRTGAVGSKLTGPEVEGLYYGGGEGGGGGWVFFF